MVTQDRFCFALILMALILLEKYLWMHIRLTTCSPILYYYSHQPDHLIIAFTYLINCV